MRNTRDKGFTLVELIVVLVITGIIASVIGVFIVRPVESFVDQSRLAELVDVGEMAMQRMARDIRAALPNSVRTDPAGTGTTLEMINVKDAGRYRAGPGTPPVGGTSARRLRFNQPDDAFNIMGPRELNIAAGDRLAIFPLGPGQPDGDPYAGDNVITPAGTTVSITDDGPVPGEHRVTLSSAHRFAFESPAQRVFVVDGPVAYVCDNGALTRHSGYEIGASVPTAGGALVASGLTACQFQYNPGTATRNAVVTMQITVARDGESVSLVRQVHVGNAP